MFSVKMVYLTVPIAALRVTKLVTEYQNLFILRDIKALSIQYKTILTQTLFRV